MSDIGALRAAEDAFEVHFVGCRRCGCGPGLDLCAKGRRLHTEYARAKMKVERG